MKIDFTVGDFKCNDNAIGIGNAHRMFADELSLQRMKPQLRIIRIFLKLMQHIGEITRQIAMLLQKPLGVPLEGVEPLRFGDKAIAIVRKDGAAQVIRRKFMTFGKIYGDKPFKLGEATYFLTPVGKRKVGCK